MLTQHSSTLKGQSAIEYLMTYGWMLLVVAIVGGAIFATVQGQCVETTSGFSGSDIRVEEFGLTGSGNLQMVVQNGGSDPINVTEATLATRNGDTSMTNSSTELSNLEIDVGGQETITLNDKTLVSSGGCNTFDLSFVYESGALSNQVANGTLTKSMEFQ